MAAKANLMAEMQTHVNPALESEARLPRLTLVPARNDVGLQPIVVARFPFLISKCDESVARYRDQFAHQVNYISRRHAELILKGDALFVQDLGSTNGTFVGGERVGAEPTPLSDGDVLGFGGRHFVYTVRLEATRSRTRAPALAPSAPRKPARQDKLEPALADAAAAARSVATDYAGPGRIEPALHAAKKVAPAPAPTQAPPAAPRPAEDAAGHDRTTFIAAGAPFLDIFCAPDAAKRKQATPQEAPKKSGEAMKPAPKARARSNTAIVLSELKEALSEGEPGRTRRSLWWTAAVIAALGAGSLAIYLSGSSQRQLKELFARGEYARAATVANEYLQKRPEDDAIRTLGTEALLKAHVPGWLAMLAQQGFAHAGAALARMREASGRNENVRSWLPDLEWLTELERFVRERGGVDAPIRIYADEVRIKSLLKYWNDDVQARQRAFAAIASYVPEFKDRYAEALSHLRRLQSDESVYLTAIERLNSTIGAELDRDAPEALEEVLNDYAQKYPRLAGLDTLREDLRRYIAVAEKVRARRLGQLITLRTHTRFSTPAFEAKFRALASTERFPPAELVGRYAAVSQAWLQGDGQRALELLQEMRTGPWSDAAARDLEHKRALLEQFTALQSSRHARGYEDRLVSFYGALDPDEDAYFIRATETEVALHKDTVLARAKEAAHRAEAMWVRYRENGAITGRQRLEGEVSNALRMQAGLLSDAERNARYAIRTYAQLKVSRPAQWSKVLDEIGAEAEMQRGALLDLRKVLEARLFKAKLALLEARNDD
jgi:pSer/pThr/pTyr-binding forkhead associated (FHA) protein